MKLSNLKIPFRISDNNELNCFRDHIISSSTDFFNLLSEVMKMINFEESLLHEKCYEVSTKYRTKLRNLISNIDSIAENLQNEKEEEESKDLKMLISCYDTVKMIESCWHLCETFFLNSSNLLSIELIKWLKVQNDDVYLIQRLNELVASSEGVSNMEHHVDYWPLINDLICDGQLKNAFYLLSEHSKYARLSKLNPRIHEELKSVFLSHPFAFYADSDDNTTSQENDVPSMAVINSIKQISSPGNIKLIPYRLREWQEHICSFQVTLLTVGQSLGIVIPELIQLLDLLKGDENFIVEHSHGNITRYLLLSFLYKYPPLLNSSDILYIVRKAIEMFPLTDSDRSMDDDDNNVPSVPEDQKTLVYSLLLSCLERDCGAVLKALYEFIPLSSSSDILVVTIQACVHLTDLLAKSGAVTDILLPLPNSPNECCFLEEITLQLSELLSNRVYSIKVIQGYLQSCPTRGIEWMSALFGHRKLYDDEEAFEIAHILNEINSVSLPASSVLITRGMYWYKQGNRNGIIQSMPFFQAAGDRSRTAAILDRTLWAISCAVTCCPELFPNLSCYPHQPSLPIRGYCITSPSDLTESIGKQLPLESLFTLVSDLQIYLPSKYWPDHYVYSNYWNVKYGNNKDSISYPKLNRKEIMTEYQVLLNKENILELLKFGKEVLVGLLDPTTMEGSPAIPLSTYVHTITSIIIASEHYTNLTQFKQNLTINTDNSNETEKKNVLVLDETTLMLICHSFDELQSAGIRIYDMLENQSIAMRYWLHMIDICIWINTRYRDYLQFIKTCESDESLVSKDLIKTITSLPSSIFNKTQVYTLITRVVKLENSISGDYLQSKISKESIHEIKIKITEIWASTVIQENSKIGQINLEREEKTKSKIQQMYQVDNSDLKYFELLSLSGSLEL